MLLASQKSFAGGEIDPQLWGRSDLAKYQIGLAKCLNWLVNPGGSCSNRPGTKYIATTKGVPSFETVRLIKSVRDSDSVYLLEFGNQYIRIFKDDAPIYISGSPAWSGATSYDPGDFVTQSGVQYYCFKANLNHDPDSLSSFLYWYPLAPSGLLEIPAPYAAADVRALQYVQSVDVISLTHPTYAVYELKRYSDTRWTLTSPVFGPGVGIPTGVAVAAGRPFVPAGSPVVSATGGNAALSKDYYIILAVLSPNPGDQYKLSSNAAVATVGGADGGNPVALAWTAASPPGGYSVATYAIYKLVGAEYRYVAATGGLTFSDDASISPTSPLASGSNNILTYIYAVTAVSPTGVEGLLSASGNATGLYLDGDHPNLITWSPVAGASAYNVYRSISGVFSFIGSSSLGTFSDPGIVSDKSVHPPSDATVFAADGDYPSTVSYFQQRYCFGSSLNDPEKFWLSRTGDFHNFTTSTPIGDDSAVIAKINGNKFNPVLFFLDLGGLVVFTASAVYALDGNAYGVVTPSSINPRLQSGIGCSATLHPLVVNNAALYVQKLGNVVRGLQFNLQQRSYSSEQISLLAQHLFIGHSIVAWDYAEIPGSIAWAAREDGALLGLTYLPGEQVYAWHQHNLDGGAVEDVIAMPGDGEDSVYLLVRRTINGSEVRYIEKMASRLVIDAATDSHFVDCGLIVTPQIASPFSPWSLKLTAGTTWAPGDYATLVSSANIFSQFGTFQPGDVLVLGFGTTFIRASIFGTSPVTAVNHVVVQLLDEVPAAVRSVTTLTWARSTDPLALVTSVTLPHLIGETVIGLADGNVIGPFVVPGDGVVDLGLANPATCVHIGLPITADWQMLDPPDVPGVQRRRSFLVQRASVRFFKTRGVKGGVDFDNLREWEPDQPTAFDGSIAMFTGQMDIELDAMWQRQGGVCLRQDQPLPATICAVELIGANAGD